MKPCEEVIVTLKFEFQEIDMELPTFMSWGTLSQKILECLRENESRKYAPFTRLTATHAGTPLIATDTLASRGIWDGSVLFCILG
ncbi:EsaB/YukD family protein [Candidatus Epulonipiscium viviparus]|uniref:EsaB/YukD family protein n=1 Tax=Candidatus Epulonipiscium viviparus TaxID=420336 RepID=UPI00016C09D2|nr:EsaB/YukD family protein [Candidatus Epulopiscium viviparus]